MYIEKYLEQPHFEKNLSKNRAGDLKNINKQLNVLFLCSLVTTQIVRQNN